MAICKNYVHTYIIHVYDNFAAVGNVVGIHCKYIYTCAVHVHISIPIAGTKIAIAHVKN